MSPSSGTGSPAGRHRDRPWAISCLVLDFDGTILDTEEPVYRSWYELWERQGEQLGRAAWQRIIGTASGFDPWAELERRLGRPLDPALAARRRTRRDELQAAQSVRPGVRSWIEEAAQLGVPVGVASSSPAEWVLSHLTDRGLRGQISSVVCAGDQIPSKPDPTSYRMTCERLGADPARSVAVEDSPHGVAAAVAAGLFTIAVPDALTADLDLSAASVVLSSLERMTLSDALQSALDRTAR